jgi:DNA-binding PadR family transcriptional regulator
MSGWESGGQQRRPDEDRGGREFADAVLAAVAEMAARSPRRQAEMQVALRRAGIAAIAERIEPVLRMLEADGCLADVVRLRDGGVLVSLTAAGMDRLAGTARRHSAFAILPFARR